MGALDPFHVAIELGRAGRKYEEAYAQLLASIFELGTELAVPIHLYSTDLEGHPIPHLPQEGSGSDSRGPAVNAYHIPLAAEVPGGEVLQYNPGQRP